MQRPLKQREARRETRREELERNARNKRAAKKVNGRDEQEGVQRSSHGDVLCAAAEKEREEWWEMLGRTTVYTSFNIN